VARGAGELVEFGDGEAPTAPPIAFDPSIIGSAAQTKVRDTEALGGVTDSDESVASAAGVIVQVVAREAAIAAQTDRALDVFAVGCGALAPGRHPHALGGDVDFEEGIVEIGRGERAGELVEVGDRESAAAWCAVALDVSLVGGGA
jgi:hypothetical protein